MAPSEPGGRKGKGKRHSEGLITAKKGPQISTQRNRKPQNSESIQGKPALITCTGQITIINAVVTSKGKLPKAVDNKFEQGTVKGTSQRTEKAYPDPEDLEEDTLETVNPQARGLEQYGSSSSAPPTPQRPCQWSMDSKRLYLAYHWEELGESFQKICIKEIDFKALIIITKGWNPTRKFRLLEQRATRIRENQATIQAIEEQLTQTGHNEIPSGLKGEGQTSSPVASHHCRTNRSVAKSHHSSQYQVVSRRRQG
ncbi:hypothetical protein O181_078371 [Austropuccinia psidii MF-1]|uniref:Uncharacterized protein n=1 Tax=Austropuccinia psidii MF-1 TaxID=1389203 RepID=A0A9Q3FJW5_9BASI|nr:hypothetical protein [Austropuccinia psidii MF-1]